MGIFGVFSHVQKIKISLKNSLPEPGEHKRVRHIRDETKKSLQYYKPRIAVKQALKPIQNHTPKCLGHYFLLLAIFLNTCSMKIYLLLHFEHNKSVSFGMATRVYFIKEKNFQILESFQSKLQDWFRNSMADIFFELNPLKHVGIQIHHSKSLSTIDFLFDMQFFISGM